MKIIAGIGYDERHPNFPTEQLGIQLCGEQSLIDEVEFRAGIVKQSTSKALRVVAYLKALKTADHGNRFYTASLATDPIASAETLLNWRDWAILHGWKYDNRSYDSGRLIELADVETHFTEATPSQGERIYRILPFLETVSTSIDEVILHSTIKSWPPLYQTLFSNMETTGIVITEDLNTPEPKAKAHTDLGKLQRALVTGDLSPLVLTNDGTIQLVSTASHQFAAQYSVQAATEKAIIIAQEQQHCVEAVINSSSKTPSGLGSLSSSRAPNQLLQLCLQCAWKTPSPKVVLQYLTLPAGKFRRLRHKLAKHFRDLPGYDVNAWQIVIDNFVSDILSADADTDETILRQSINDWLPISTCNSDENMPIEFAVSLTDQVSSYWQKRSISTTDNETQEIFMAAFSAAEAAANALRDWPDANISKIQLNRLTSMAHDLGHSRWHQSREVTTFDIVQNPEAALLRETEIDQLIWIDPKMSSSHLPPPLSNSEISGLPLALNDEQQAEVQQLNLIRTYSALLRASQSICLISIEQTPDLLKLLLSELIGIDVWPNLEDLILQNKGITIPLITTTDFALPLVSRWWNIEKAVPAPREKESFSSLSSLALKPHEYTLRYPARIHEGSINSIAVDARLKGNLAHKVVETWINEQPWAGLNIERSTIASWLEERLPQLIRQIALPLAQPGTNVDRLQFQQLMLNAMDALFTALTKAQVTSLFPEIRMGHSGVLGHIEGTMDILCEFANGSFAVIDMKWGGYTRYSEELKAGRPLQLATYAHIAEGNRPEKLLDAGYYILSRAELLCTNNITFPTATAIEPDSPTSFQLTWRQLKKTLQWRIEQLQQGAIELTYGQAEPDDHSTPPENTLPLLEMEEIFHRKQRNSYLKTFKTIDAWRNLTGNFKEQ